METDPSEHKLERNESYSVYFRWCACVCIVCKHECCRGLYPQFGVCVYIYIYIYILYINIYMNPYMALTACRPRPYMVHWGPLSCANVFCDIAKMVVSAGGRPQGIIQIREMPLELLDRPEGPSHLFYTLP